MPLLICNPTITVEAKLNETLDLTSQTLTGQAPEPTTTLSGLVGIVGVLSAAAATPDSAFGGGGGSFSGIAPVPQITLSGGGQLTGTIHATAPLPTPSFIAALAATANSIAWVVNLRTLGVSRYENFAAESLFEVDGVYYGCFADGIYRLDGDHDGAADIAASATLGVIDTRNQSYIAKAYAETSANGEMTLTLSNEFDGDMVYDFDPSSTSGIHAESVRLARGSRGREWIVKIANRNGSDFNLQGLGLILDITSRKV